jgi:2-oxoisovalerate dehydrogenase E1 component alpha subunit
MPCHPGSRDARYVTMSSCIATQLPHAVGMAMAAKLRHDPVYI